MKRAFDIVASLIGLLLLSPVFLIITLLVPLEGKGGPFFLQTRVGRDEKPFKLLKFRTMRPDPEDRKKITVGSDPRVTRIGRILRNYKLDELPQLINVLKGDMSLVGPRPEVPEYVAHYDEEQRKVLTVRPGLTDEASLAYIDEERILREADDPQRRYLEEVMPAKLELNLRYVKERSMKKDLRLILRTIGKIVGGKGGYQG